MKRALCLLPAVRTGVRLLVLAAGVACSAAPQAPAQSANSNSAVAPEPNTSTPAATDSPDADGFHLTDFVGLGRADRIADLGSGRGYSIEAFVAAVGPFGAVYVRHDPRTLSALPSEQREGVAEAALPSNVIRMDTPLEAPFSAEAKNLDCATLLFSYHELVAERRDLQRFNAAVFAALKPGGCYIVVEHAPRGPAEPAGAGDANRIAARAVRSEVEAVGFRFVEAADFFTPAAAPVTGQQPTQQASQYVLKFQKPRPR
jgi:predicted methyltransferase